jgi:hypothetical protein
MTSPVRQRYSMTQSRLYWWWCVVARMNQFPFIQITPCGSRREARWLARAWNKKIGAIGTKLPWRVRKMEFRLFKPQAGYDIRGLDIARAPGIIGPISKI